MQRYLNRPAVLNVVVAPQGADCAVLKPHVGSGSWQTALWNPARLVNVIESPALIVTSFGENKLLPDNVTTTVAARAGGEEIAVDKQAATRSGTLRKN